MRQRLSVIAATLVSALLAAPALRADTEIKIGTLAPKSSVWGKVFQVWQDAVAEKSNGDLRLSFFWNGSQGDDISMVDKMRTGSQLDGAALSPLGLGRIYRPVLAMQIPGLFRSYESMDKAKAAVFPDIQREFDNAGFVLGSLGDIGISHLMSKGFAVREPNDLKGKRPVLFNEDVIGPVFFRIVGGVTPVPLSVPAILPALGNDSVNVVSASALAASQLQWSSKLDHINVNGGSVMIGGLVLKKSTLEALPADQRAMLKETGEVAAKALRERVRKADAQSFETLKKRMTNVELTKEEQEKWADVIKRTVEALGQGTFEPAWLKRLADMRG